MYEQYSCVGSSSRDVPAVSQKRWHLAWLSYQEGLCVCVAPSIGEVIGDVPDVRPLFRYIWPISLQPGLGAFAAASWVAVPAHDLILGF